MKKVVFSIYDMQADYFDSPMVFDDLKLGVGSLRRNIRDMYLRNEVTLDALHQRKQNQYASLQSSNCSQDQCC